MTNIKDIFINNIAPEQFHDWAYEKTLREILDECQNHDWLLWLLSKVLGTENEQFIQLKGLCAYTIKDIVNEPEFENAVSAAISLNTASTYGHWLEMKAVAELAQKNISMDAYVVDNPILIVKSMFYRWIYDEDTYTNFLNASLIYSYINAEHNHNLCMSNILTIIKNNTQNLT